MSGTAADVARAKAEAAAARGRLVATMHELQGRVQPQVLMQEGVDRLRRRGNDLADDALGAARARPGAAAAIAGAVVLLVLRRPLFRLVRRLFSKRDETPGPQTG